MDFISNRRTILFGGIALIGGGAFGIASGVLRAKKSVVAQEDTPLSIALLEAHAERLEQLIDAYSVQSGIEIEVTPLAYGELYSQLSLALTQRSPAFDVVSLDDPWIPQFATFLAPVELDAAFADAVVPVARALSRYPDDAASCGLPWLGDSQFFVNRPAWLDRSDLRAPVTWNETTNTATAIAAALPADDELAAFAISTLTPHQIVDSFLPILRGCGKDLIDPETSVPQLDTPEALEAVGFLQRLATLSPLESTATGEPSNMERFEAGDIAMMSNFWASALLASVTVQTTRNPGPVACDLQPAQPGVERRSMTGIWIAGIPIGSKRQDEALDFMEWLVSSSTQRAMVELALPPVLAPVYADDGLIGRQPHLPKLLDLLAGSQPRPRSPYYPQLELLLATELESMLDGQQTGEDAVRNANIAMREFLAREGVLES